VCIKSPPLISYQYFRREMFNKKQMWRLFRNGAPKFEEAKANQEINRNRNSENRDWGNLASLSIWSFEHVVGYRRV
jgi:hypothetical protein